MSPRHITSVLIQPGSTTVPAPTLTCTGSAEAAAAAAARWNRRDSTGARTAVRASLTSRRAV